jgi:cytoplasmic iron level regulating protein YaaA (DUF328/UPF0246 family)
MKKFRSKTALFVSCVKTKRTKPSKAKKLYKSAWFKKARRYAEQSGKRWFILSALHGMVSPEKVVKPYELTLNKMPVRERKQWAKLVAEQIKAALPRLNHAVFLAGNRYREFLMKYLEKRNVKVSVPMKGLSNGKQNGWLKQRIRVRKK